MSGAELALAIVPLVIVLVEHHRTVIRRGKAVTLSRISNDQQLDFYQELHAELSLLNVTLDRVKAVCVKTGLSRARPEESEEVLIDIALGDRAPDFKQILDRVMKSINDLVREKSSVLTRDDTGDQRAMLQRLEQFKKSLAKSGASKSMREKFRFTRNEKTRNVAMKRIHDGVLNLERLLGSSTEMFDHQSRASRRRTPVTRTRRLSEELYKKMASKWPRSCSCHTRHMAMLCLWNCCCTHEDRNGSDDSLDMVVSMPNGGQNVPKWQESTIHVSESDDQTDDSNSGENHVHFACNPSTTPSRPSPGRDVDSQSFCELLQKAQTHKSSLQIMFESGKLWQKMSKPLRLQIRDQTDISLQSLLGNSQGWRLREKSILAVVLAHAALHCSEGPWLRADWSKEHVSFFKKDDAQQPDLSRPFLQMDFTEQTVTDEEDEMFMMHSNPALLSLGVLLLEIGKNSSIERHWSAEDLMDDETPNESTNLTAALRLLENSDGDLVVGYRKAVRACLEWDVVNGGREDEDFAKRMYEYIVEPLERELEHGFDIAPEQLGLMGMMKA